MGQWRLSILKKTQDFPEIIENKEMIHSGGFLNLDLPHLKTRQFYKTNPYDIQFNWVLAPIALKYLILLAF